MAQETVKSQALSQYGSQSAYPLTGDVWMKRVGYGISERELQGLSKREYFAGLAMQGVLSGRSFNIAGPKQIDFVARYSVKYADELLKALGD